MIRGRRCIAGRGAGFTLIEVLLALALSAALLAGLWAALEISLRMFESGRRRVEDAQLARALLHQLDRDLRDVVSPADPQATGAVLVGAVPPESSGKSDDAPRHDRRTNRQSGTSVAESGPSSPGRRQNLQPAEGMSSARRQPKQQRQPGLFGSAHELRIDVCRVPTRRASPPLDRADMAPQATELRTIYYLLARARPIERYTLDAPEYQGTGLVRYETAWLDSPLEETPANIRAAEATTQDRLFEEFLALEEHYERSQSETAIAPLAEGVDEDLSTSPEVIGLEFRYFDGVDWLSSWDSEAQGKLPTAVELALVLEPPGDQRNDREAEADLSAPAHSQPLPPSVRLVTQLPLGRRAGNDAEPAIVPGDDGPAPGDER